ncbi:nitroreductase family deazaflavin-dependent oxidoreductase [Nocardia sp. NPDC057353]|uniref:nitroreductase family deazaflavin-dependent oxidoreductase n=1 Tax=Nocardia sp. NPDC057353 TaxID=3346104 RepID=UPI003631A9C3
MSQVALPRKVRFFNVVIKGLQRIGLSTGPVTVLTVRGRKSGQPRSTPVTPFRLDGAEYVLSGLPGSAWAHNVRAADTVELRSGRRTRTARMVEIPVAERGPILRAFVEQVPRGVAMMRDAGVVRTGSVAEFEAAADRLAPFRIDPA